VITVHNAIQYHKNILLKTIFRKSTFVKCSPAIRDLGSIRKEYVIPNGVNLERFIPKLDYKSDIRNIFEIPINSILLTSVGNLREQKNQKVLVDTIYELKKKHKISNVHLLLVGRGPEYDDIYNRAVNLNVEDKIHFLGLRKDVPELLYNSDIFISSSLWEGLPLAVIEAFASGIITLISPIHEHIVIGKEMKECYFPSEISGKSYAEILYMIINKTDRPDHHRIWLERKDDMNLYSMETFSASYEDLYKKLAI
jgi:glycosyltransferase involved in cell wall biosynthesis